MLPVYIFGSNHGLDVKTGMFMFSVGCGTMWYMRQCEMWDTVDCETLWDVGSEQ